VVARFSFSGYGILFRAVNVDCRRLNFCKGLRLTAGRSYRLLVVTDSDTVFRQLDSLFKESGMMLRAERLENSTDIELALGREDSHWDLVLAEVHLDPLHALALLRRSAPDLPMLVLSRDRDDKRAVEALNYGARDIVSLDEKRFLHVVLRELGDAEWRRTGQRLQAALEESEQRASALLDSSREAIAYLHEGMHVYANQEYLKLFGFGGIEDLDGVPLLDLIAADGQSDFKDFMRRTQQTPQGPIHLVIRLQTGQTQREVTMEARRATYGGEACTQLIVRPRMSDKALETEIRRLRDLDPLTGLFNRQYLLQAVAEAIARAVKGEGDSTLLYVELDDLEAVTASVGIPAADRVLREISAIVSEHIRDGATVARFADQAFTALLDTDDLERVRVLADGLRKAIEERVLDVDGKTVVTTCTIGICLITSQTSSVHNAIISAKTASSEGRQRGGNQVAVHQGSWQEYAEDKQWPRRIREALDSDQFRLFYQPVVSLHGEMRELYEVLLRMFDTQGTMLPPEQFMSRAVEAGMVPALDRWVLEHVGPVFARERAKGRDPWFFIRLSEESLSDRPLLDWIEAQARAAALPSDRVVLELSEASAAIHLRDVSALLGLLKPLQFRFALSHFGQRSNSFGLLRHLDVDYVKVDGTLVRYVTRDPKVQASVRAIIEAAHAAGKLTVAEDLEDAETLALLWQYGVDYARGYYVQIPTERPEFDFLANL
jgi:diguanylate cyclase (GGDEF)-like protein/PAS domain S-box-containing protein